MSRKPTVDPAQLEEALRAAFESVLPQLVDAIAARLHSPKPVRPHRGARADLGPLFDAARAGGERAVQAVLDQATDLVAIASSLDRSLAARARKAKNLSSIRTAIAAEIMRRAVRNDVFLPSDTSAVGGRQSDE